MGKKLEGTPLASLWMVHETDLVNRSKIKGLLRPRKEYLSPFACMTSLWNKWSCFLSLSFALRSRGYDERFDQIQVMQYQSLCDRWDDSLWYLILRYYSLLVLHPAHVQLVEVPLPSAVVSWHQMSAVCRNLPSSLSLFSWTTLAKILRAISAIRKKYLNYYSISRKFSLWTAAAQWLL